MCERKSNETVITLIIIAFPTQRIGAIKKSPTRAFQLIMWQVRDESRSNKSGRGSKAFVFFSFLLFSLSFFLMCFFILSSSLSFFFMCFFVLSSLSFFLMCFLISFFSLSFSSSFPFLAVLLPVPSLLVYFVFSFSFWSFFIFIGLLPPPSFFLDFFTFPLFYPSPYPFILHHIHLLPPSTSYLSPCPSSCRASSSSRTQARRPPLSSLHTATCLLHQRLTYF